MINYHFGLPALHASPSPSLQSRLWVSLQRNIFLLGQSFVGFWLILNIAKVRVELLVLKPLIHSPFPSTLQMSTPLHRKTTPTPSSAPPILAKKWSRWILTYFCFSSLFSDWKVSCQVKEKDRYHIGDWQEEIDIIIFLSLNKKKGWIAWRGLGGTFEEIILNKS